MRITLSAGMACGVTGLYLTGPEQESCPGCTYDPNPAVAVAIFSVVALVSLRIAKIIGDWEKRRDL